MKEKSGFEAFTVGKEMVPFEMTLDEDTVNDRAGLVQWEAGEVMEKYHTAPPGISIAHHARMKFMTFSDLRASIWAKSEHEFIKPMKIGSKIFIRGKIVEKYVKRGRYHVVSEYETVDEAGDVLLRSRETGVYVE